jgi:hypothetical protein
MDNLIFTGYKEMIVKIYQNRLLLVFFSRAVPSYTLGM